MSQIKNPIGIEGQNTFMDMVSHASAPISTSTWESIKASYELSQRDATTTALVRFSELSKLKHQDGEQLSPQELNEMYPDMEIPFSSPMNRLAADEIWERKQRADALQMRIANGPDNWYTTALGFGASLLPHAFDPLNVASTLAIGGPLASMMKGWKYTSALPASARIITADIAANLALEPAVHLASQAEQRQYTMYDSLLNSVGGAIGGEVVRYGFKGLRQVPRLLRSKISGANIKPEVSQMLANAQGVQGLKPNVDGIYKAGRYLKFEGPEAPYKLESLDVGNVSERTFFEANSDSIMFNSDTKGYGEGTYLVENRNMAERLKADPYVDSPTNNLNEFNFRSASIIDADKGITFEQKKALIEDIGASPADAKGINSVRDAMEYLKTAEDIGKLPEGSLENYKQALREQGVDGLHYVENIHGDRSNVLLSLNDEMVQNVGSNPMRKSSMDMEMVEKEAMDYAMDKKNKIFYDADVEADYTKVMNMDVDNIKASKVKEVEAKLEEIKANKEFYGEEGIKVLEEDLDSLNIEEVKEAKLTHLSKKCLSGG